MSNILETKIELINNKMKYSASAGENPPIILDYLPPFGDGEGYTSLELLLFSFSSCASNTLKFLMKDTVFEKLEVKARGTRHTTHPTGFKEIFLEFIINAENINETDILKILEHQLDKYCPVWSMIKNNVEVFYKVTLL